MEELKWLSTEKKIAHAIYEKALSNEIEEIKREVINKAENLKSGTDIWDLEFYIRDRRRSIDKRYQFSYSYLPLLFGLLLADDYLTEDDLKGLGEDKIEIIKRASSLNL